MRLYNALSRFRPTSNSYSKKFLLVAFIGIHLPIIALVTALLFTNLTESKWTIVLVVLIMTLVSSILTLTILNKLTSPILRAAEGVQAYRSQRTIPNWKRNGGDELSSLLQNLESMLHELEVHRIHQEDMSMLLSHDLRSPISAAIQTIELSKSQDDIVEMKDTLVQLQDYLKDQLSFIDVMLQIQKHQSSTDEFEMELINIAPLVQSCVDQVAPQAKEKGIEIKILSDKNTIIHAHNRMANQCILNLLNNAIKFSFESGTIDISWSQKDGMVQLDITDHGMGMNPHIQSQLFTKISEAGRLGTGGEKSMGLGLYLTKTLMRNQRGTAVAVSPGVNKGSTFSLIFNTL